MNKTLFILFQLTFSFSAIKSPAQSMTLEPNSIGFIVMDTVITGTGFVMMTPNTVVTCAHVIVPGRTISFFADRLYFMELIKLDTENDIAILRSKIDICRVPPMSDTASVIRPLQHLFYFGYNQGLSNTDKKVIEINGSQVDAVGKIASGIKTIDFVEFLGVGKPGYSGGPVYNDSGKIVAFITQAWLRQGIKGGPVQLMNRAFSIKLVYDNL